MMAGVERSVIYIVVAALAALVLVPWLASFVFPDQVYFDWPFFFEVFIGGLLAGVMYSLVALGFVLIFKASGVFNFAQGVMVLFAALTLVGLMETGPPSWVAGVGAVVFFLSFCVWGARDLLFVPRKFPVGYGIAVLTLLVLYLLSGRSLPVWAALLGTVAVMILLAIVIERVVLRPLVNQEPIILFMATIGIAFFLDGFGQTIWGSEVKPLNPPLIADLQYQNVEFSGVRVNYFDLFAAVTAGILVTVLALFFQKTRIGRALRAVADDHQAAMSVGIPLKNIWAIVWSVAGIVALVAGIIWGTKLSVQFSLSLIALKALPVLILGGFTSIPGAIIGGLLIGAGEKVSEVFLGPLVGGGIEDWFAYMLALVFLVFRPQGMFGEKIIERV